MIGRRRLLQGILAGGAGAALTEVRLPLVDQAVWGGYVSTQP